MVIKTAAYEGNQICFYIFFYVMHQVTQLNHLASPCKKNVEEEEEEEMHGGASVAKKEEAQRMLSSLSSLAGRPPARLFVSRGRGRGGTASHLLTQTRCPPARSRTHGKENEAAGGGTRVRTRSR